MKNDFLQVPGTLSGSTLTFNMPHLEEGCFVDLSQAYICITKTNNEDKVEPTRTNNTKHKKRKKRKNH